MQLRMRTECNTDYLILSYRENEKHPVRAQIDGMAETAVRGELDLQGLMKLNIQYGEYDQTIENVRVLSMDANGEFGFVVDSEAPGGKYTQMHLKDAQCISICNQN